MSESTKPDYALWDTLPDLRFEWGFFTAPTPTDARKRRAFDRTADFAAAAAGHAPAPSLGQDLARRRDRWQEQLDHDESDERPKRRSWLGSIVEALTFGADEIIALAALAAFAAFLIGMVLGVALAIPWLIWHISRVRRRRRCRRALEHSCCPDCEYDLNGAPEPIDRDLLGGLSAGPDRCPECGVPWPLVPPPVRRR